MKPKLDLQARSWQRKNYPIRDHSLFMAGGGGVAPKRNWLCRQNITQDQSKVGKNIWDEKGG